jgi:hypothetical protein
MAPVDTVTPLAPPAPPAAAAPATVEHISALHRHLDEVVSWMGQKFKEVIALVEKAAPVAEAAAAALAPVIGTVGAAAAAAVQKVAGVVEGLACCGHTQSQHFVNGLCAEPGCSCKGPAK